MSKAQSTNQTNQSPVALTYGEEAVLRVEGNVYPSLGESV